MSQGTASIQFEADLSPAFAQVGPKLEQILSRLEAVATKVFAALEQSAGRAGQSTDAVQTAALAAAAALDQVDGGGLNAAQAAASAATSATTGTASAANAAAAALDGIDGSTLHQTASAANAATSSTASLDAAAEAAANALDQIDSSALDDVTTAADVSTDALDEAADAAADLVDALDDAADSTDQLASSADRSGGMLSKLGGMAGGAMGKIAKLGGVIAGVAGLGGLGVILTKGMDRLMAIDDAKAKLKGLHHSVEDIDVIMESAMAGVKGTAYGLGDAAGIAAGAVAAGIEPGEKLTRTLKLTGDAAAIAGTDLSSMGSIFNKVAIDGKVSGDVIAQMSDQGIPIMKLLGDEIGVTGDTLSKMVTDGKIDFETFQNAIESGMGGAAVAAGQTFRGAVDNMGASLGRLGAAILDAPFKAAPDLIGGMTASVDTATTKLKGLQEVLIAGDFGEEFRKAFPGMEEDDPFVDRLFNIREGVIKVIEAGKLLATGDFTGGFAAAFGVEEDSDLVDRLFTVRELVIDWGAQLGRIFESAKSLVQGLIGPLTEIGGSLATASAAIGISVWQILLDVIEALIPAIEAILIPALQFLADLMAENQGVVTALVGAYTAWRVIALGVAIAQGIQTAATGASTAAIVGSRASMIAHTATAAVMKGAQLAGAAATGIATAATWAFNAAVVVLTSPITLVIVAIAALVAGLVWFFTQTDIGKAIITAAWDAIQAAISFAWENVIKPVFDAFVGAFVWIGEQLTWLWESVISPIFGFIGNLISVWWDGVQLYFRLWGAAFEVMGTAVSMLWDNVLQPVFGWIGGLFASWWDGVKIYFGFWKDAFALAGDAVMWLWDHAVMPVLTWIGDKWNWLYDNVIAPVAGWIGDRMRDAGAAFESLWNAVSKVAGWIGDKISDVVGFFTGLKDKIFGAFKGAGTWLFDMGKDIVQGLLDGAGDLLSKIGEFFLDKVPGWIKGPFKKALGIKSPSKVFAGFGENIGQGLIDGVDAMSGKVQSATQSMANAAGDVTMPTLGVADSAAMPVAGGDGASLPDLSTVLPDLGTLGAGVAAAATDVIDPAITGMTANISALGAAFPSVNSTMVQPTMLAMGAGILAAKTTLIDPALAGMSASLTATGTATTTMVQATVLPQWTAMGAGILATKTGTVDPALAGIQGGLAVTGTAAVDMVQGVVLPQFSAMGAGILDVKTGTIDPVFAGIQGGLITVQDAFANGATAIASQWDRVREATAAPVRFAITSVFNDGIVGMWNSVSDLLGTDKMAAYPLNFAAGGRVPGTGDKDSVPAMLMPDEFVASRPMLAAIGGGSLDRGLAMMETVRQRAGSATSSLGAEGLFSAVAGRYSAGGVVQGTPAWEQLKKGHAFASKWSGSPYVWGGSFGANAGTDCSGYMSSIADVILGGTGASRKWATASFPGGGMSQAAAANAGGQTWASGLAAGLSIGVSNVHTAGTLGGIDGLPTVNVESGGSPSKVKYGAQAAGADHSQFPSRYHLPIASGNFVSGGQYGGPAISFGDIIGAITGPAREKLGGVIGGWPIGGMIDSYPGKMAETMTTAVDTKIDKLIEELSHFDDPGGSGVERWKPLVQLMLQRYDLGLEHTDRTLRRMNQESSGDPRAINLTDSNAAAGHPSKGLMQVIDPTFQTNRDPMLSPDIWDPMANVGASMRYAIAQYGNLPAAYDRAGGYHAGGMLPAGEGWWHKTALEPERVLSPGQNVLFEQLVGGLTRGKGGVQVGGMTVGTSGNMTINPDMVRGSTGPFDVERLAAALAKNGVGRQTTIHAPFTVKGGEAGGRAAADQLLSLIN